MIEVEDDVEESVEVRLPNGWQQRHYQRPFWKAFQRGKKRASLAWHRRSGKDDVSLHWTACASQERVGTYWHMLPEAAQARKAIWDAVNPHTGKRRIDEAFPEIIRESTRSQDMFIRFKNGSTWQVVGSDNFDSLVGTPPVGLVFSEYALADPQAWSILRPILRENGGWAIFISTPRGKNHFWRLHNYALTDPENWFAETLGVQDTHAMSASDLAQELREITAERGPVEAQSIIDQEYHCSFDAAIPGTYYAWHLAEARKHDRVGPQHKFDPRYRVYTFWDLGFGDSTAIWFVQVINGRVRIIDYLEGHGVGLEWYAARLKARRDKAGYRYEEHVGPHDAAHGELGTGKTRIETLAEYGIVMRVLPVAPVDDGIQVVRKLLPKCDFFEGTPWVDESIDESPDMARDRITRGLDALSQYRRKYDEKLKKYADSPLHDWCSHAADAFRYLGMGIVIPDADDAKVMQSWPVYAHDKAPDKSHALLTAYVDPNTDAWAIVVGRVFRPADADCVKAKLKEVRPSLLVMAAASGTSWDSLLDKAKQMAADHDVEHGWLPEHRAYEPLRRQLRRQEVRLWRYVAPDPLVMIAVAREITKERVTWIPERRWARQVCEALLHYPQHTDAVKAIALACLMTFMRHRNQVLSQDEDEPVTIRTPHHAPHYA